MSVQAQEALDELETVLRFRCQSLEELDCALGHIAALRLAFEALTKAAALLPAWATHLSEMHVGTCAHCKLAVTEADSWTHDGPDMGGYPPTVPVYHSTCKAEALIEAPETEGKPS